MKSTKTACMEKTWVRTGQGRRHDFEHGNSIRSQVVAAVCEYYEVLEGSGEVVTTDVRELLHFSFVFVLLIKN